MERVNLFLLHGFLGRPADWESVRVALPKSDRLHIYTPDYFKEKNLGPQHNFASWAQSFNRWVQMETHGADRNIIVGYSLGGRLALHALEQKPALWYKAMLVSTNPGFNDHLSTFDPSSDERRARWMNDSYWAEEFLKSSWETLLRNWNAQPVFGGADHEPVRLEKDYSREALGLALTQWSLAQQKNMRTVLSDLASKVHWAVGERDEKFLAMAQQLQEEVFGLKLDVIPGASHRVLFDRPRDLADKIKALLQQLL